MNSLKHLKGEHAQEWKAVFVRYFEYYLQGSKDPDTKFKDFRNHVLHVQDNFWGGPVSQAERWYASTVKRLQEGDFKSAVYCAGVLSHYFMDPLMPLHTGQTEEEGVIHRACEWSINKAFPNLICELEAGSGYPEVQLPGGSDWLKKLIRHNATIANGHYQTFIDHYDIKQGARRPVEGLDQRLREVSAALLGYASICFARILERAFVESSAVPNQQAGSALRYYYLLTRPISWGMKWFRNWGGSRSVKKIATEYLKFGKVIDALPKDEQIIRSLHAKEILKIELEKLDEQEIRPVGSKVIGRVSESVAVDSHEPDSGTVRAVPDDNSSQASAANADQSTESARQKFRLSPGDPIVDAPSIGEKTAARMKAVGIRTVGQFISVDPAKCAKALNLRYLDANQVQQWQTQSRLACQIPGIYGHDAQILVACGFDSPTEIANTDVDSILSLVAEFEKTKEAQFILRSSKAPDREEISNWIKWSGQSRSLSKAA